MLDDLSNRGILFCNLPKDVAEACGATSNADVHLKIARAASPEKNHINSDQQIFRKMRKRTLSKEEITKFWKELLELSSNDVLNLKKTLHELDIEIDLYGAWMPIYSMLNGIRTNVLSIEKKGYIDFLIEIIEVEKYIIRKIQKIPKNEIYENGYQILPQVLPVDQRYYEADKPTRYFYWHCAKLLFWCTLLEKFISIYFEEYANKDSILPFFPSMKNGKISYPVENLFEYAKDKYSESKGKKQSWNKIYEYLLKNDSEESIKKQIQRIKSGNLTLTRKNFLKYIEPLLPKNESEIDAYLWKIPMIAILDKNFRYLKAIGISNAQLIEQIDRHSVFKDFVGNLFRTGKYEFIQLEEENIIKLAYNSPIYLLSQSDMNPTQ